MCNFLPALCWASMMILFALLARLGLADRDPVVTMLLVMPMLAFVSIRRGRRCARSATEA